MVRGLHLPRGGPACRGATGTEGDDDLVGTEEADVIAGLGGNDRIRGLDGLDVICGGAGDDTLDGDGSAKEWPIRETISDLLVGGEGDDYLTVGYFGSMFGGPGADSFVGGIVSYERAPNGVVADLGTGRAFGEGADVLVGVRGLRGSVFDDHLLGDERPNVIYGGSGADELWGAGETDVLLGDEGDDLVAGEGGDDYYLFGGAGDDFVGGGDGNDQIEPEISTLRSENDIGDDFVDGGDGFDRVSFRTGLTLSVRVDLSRRRAEGHGSDEIHGVELVEGTDGDDWIKGDEGDDVLWGLEGSDTLIGGRGDDRLDPSDFDAPADEGDVARGGPGADVLYAKDCCATAPLRGGPGRDTISFGGSFSQPYPGVSVDLRDGTWAIPDGSGSFTSIENVHGSGGPDRIVGDGRRNVLDGRWEEDVIIGLGGDDDLIGGPGSDTLDGGAGVDECGGPRDSRRRCEQRP